MAKKRMFALNIVGSDAFLEMPTSARLLYYDLGMRADDDGFINSAISIMQLTKASYDDLRLLITKKFVIPLEYGIFVIKHWNINNYIQKDRYIETLYKDQKAMLQLDSDKIYHLLGSRDQYPQIGNRMDTECIHNVYGLDTENNAEISVSIENSTCIQNGYKMDTQERERVEKEEVSKGERREKYGTLSNVLLSDNEINNLRNTYENAKALIDHISLILANAKPKDDHYAYVLKIAMQDKWPRKKIIVTEPEEKIEAVPMPDEMKEIMDKYKKSFDIDQ